MTRNRSSRMSDWETANTASSADTPIAAARAFVNRARSRLGNENTKLYVFGSPIRNETRVFASDGGNLVIFDNTAVHKVTAEILRDLAYETMLEFAPVVELHILPERKFEYPQNRSNHLFQTVVHEGHIYA